MTTADAPHHVDPPEAELAARERILRVALQAFAAGGYGGATTAEIARRAGVTQPLVHYHFNSKENLWRAAAEYAFNQFAAHLGPDEDVTRAPHVRLELLLRRMVRFSGLYPEFGRMVVMESSSGGSRAERLIERYLKPLHQHVGELIQAAQQAGLLKPVPVEHLVFLLNGAAASFFQVGPIVKELYDVEVGSAEAINRHADAVVDVLLDGLLTDRAREERRSAEPASEEQS